MKKSTFIVAIILTTVLFGCLQQGKKQEKMASVEKKTTMDSLLRHVVLFKFRDSTSAKKVKEIEDSFAALPGKINEIKEYEWGVNNSPEGLDKGLTHCFFVTFHFS